MSLRGAATGRAGRLLVKLQRVQADVIDRDVRWKASESPDTQRKAPT